MGDGAGKDGVITSGEEITGARKDGVARRRVSVCIDTHVAHMWSLRRLHLYEQLFRGGKVSLQGIREAVEGEGHVVGLPSSSPVFKNNTKKN